MPEHTGVNAKEICHAVILATCFMRSFTCFVYFSSKPHSNPEKQELLAHMPTPHFTDEETEAREVVTCQAHGPYKAGGPL